MGGPSFTHGLNVKKKKEKNHLEQRYEVGVVKKVFTFHVSKG